MPYENVTLVLRLVEGMELLYGTSSFAFFSP